MTPACFPDEKTYRLWHEAARFVSPGKHGYCADCTKEYQARMIKECRCEFPDTTFAKGADGFTDGHRSAKAIRSLGRYQISMVAVEI